MQFLKPSDYQKKTDSIFQALERDLLSILTILRVEHIGSSSIPNLVSKGDLDVFVGVSRSHFAKVIAIIKDLGFEEKSGTLRTDELCMLVTEKYNYDVAIQLVVEGSEFESFITFRDILRMNPLLVDEYNTLKLNSKDLSEGEYRIKKSGWIKEVLRKYGIEKKR